MDLARYIDHTALKANTTEGEIMTLCNEAKEYRFASVCVNPFWVKFASDKLKDVANEVKVCTVIGFPLGATTTATKAFETKDAIENGATEVDMVINIAALKAGDTAYVQEDIEAVVNAAKGKALVKVIIETCLLTDEEKVLACKLAVAAHADFVKTSTGFSTGGATVADIQLMRETVGPNVGVKASGGVRDLDGAKEMIEAGATRIGASAGVSIVKGLTGTNDY
ncbi:deoxyribose-phosphate aldolase [Alkalihalobacillus pseudalcaliphilus]|uniref:deoxyribose-phosphate aldolase n=1 Tax=Alkalihalobacillus pseudalcaliphilus TaxID=79884 RepID=UPI00064E0F39|nr:deoxyribose-phosphate aldolase [Alkalihalobacillus pseudalcaliphilus]KMK75945.1 deoxyribose-phosphate aldolase [Alkalihalobacillus pseudalcaliphilus]